MCTFLNSSRSGGMYYFRRDIPKHLQPIIGQTAWYHSLRTKDRAEAKRKVALETVRTNALLTEAEEMLAAERSAPAPADPFAGMTLEQFEQEQQYRFEQARADAADDARMEEAEAWIAGLPDDHPARLVQGAERERGDRYQLEAHSHRRRKRKDREQDAASGAAQDNAEEEPDGKGIYLDTDVLDGWAAERKPSPRGKDAYWRDAKLFNSMMGRKSVELITKPDVMAYKKKLVDDPKRSQVNVRDRLAYKRRHRSWIMIGQGLR